MIRLGIIGAGPNASGHAKKFANYPERCRLMAVADIQKPAAEALASEYGASAYEDFRQMLGKVDAVIISSPNFLHGEHAVACAGEGKHVWVEKPMALDNEEAARIAKAVEEAGVQSMVGFSVRFTGVKQSYKRLVAEGRIGQPVAVWSRRLSYFNLDTVKGWRADPAKSGGYLYELMTHEVDWIVDLVGPPLGIYAQKTSRIEPSNRANEHLWVTFQYLNGLTATLEGSWMSPMPDYYNGVTGREATLHTNKWGNELYLKTLEEQHSQQLEPDAAFDKHAHFLDVIEGKCPSVADVHYGQYITSICEAILQSALENRVIDTSGRDGEFLPGFRERLQRTGSPL